MNEPTPREFPSAPFTQICAATTDDQVTGHPWAQLFALDEHGKIWKYTNSGMIRIASLMLWLALTAPAFASPLAFDFFGTMTSGIGSGTFQYEATAPHTAENVGGLANYYYQPTSWNFSLVSTFMPSQTFASGLAGQTGELCVGICTFGSGQEIRLNLRDGAGLYFHAAFALTEPLTALPTAAGQIGGYKQALYELNDGNGGVRMALFQTGALSLGTAQLSSVPEPATWLLLGIAGLVWLVLFWSEVKP